MTIDSKRVKTAHIPGTTTVPVLRQATDFACFKFNGADFDDEHPELGVVSGYISSSCGVGGTSLYVTIKVGEENYHYLIKGTDLLDAAYVDIVAKRANGVMEAPKYGQDANGVWLPGFLEERDRKSAEYEAGRPEREAQKLKEKEEAEAKRRKVAEDKAQEAARLVENGFPDLDADGVRALGMQMGQQMLTRDIEYREPSAETKPMYAWIAPNGKAWFCSRFEHRALGDAIAAKLFGEEKTNLHLENLGWIKVGTEDFGAGRWYAMQATGAPKPTKRQLDRVFDIALAFEKAGKPLAYEAILKDWKELSGEAQ